MRVAQSNYFYQRLMWDAYSSLMDLNSTYPSRLFPLPLGVSRDSRNNSITFSYEYPITPSSVSSLKTKLSGSTLLLPLRAFLYSYHSSNRRVLASALRHYPKLIELWCSQFGQGYRSLKKFSHIQYEFNKNKSRPGPTTTNNHNNGTTMVSNPFHEDNNVVMELINKDIFVREDGSLVFSNAMVKTVEEDEDYSASRNTDPLVTVVTDLLSECLCISRTLSVQLTKADQMSSHDGANDDINNLSYIKNIEKQLQIHESEESFGDVMAMKDQNAGVTGRQDELIGHASVVYLAERSGLDIYPSLRADSGADRPVSSLCSFVLLTEAAPQSDISGTMKGMSRSSSRGSHSFVPSQHTQSNVSLSKLGAGKDLNSFLAMSDNLVVTMSASSAGVVSVVSVNGHDMDTGKVAHDAQGNTVLTLPGLRNRGGGMTRTPRQGFRFRVKAKTPGVAYITIRQSIPVSYTIEGDVTAKGPVLSAVLKVCVVDFPVTESVGLGEVISLTEASFWTPLYTPLNNSGVGGGASGRGNQNETINCREYLDRIFSGQLFRNRVSDIRVYV